MKNTIEIPNGWEEKQLKDNIQILSGYAFDSKKFNDNKEGIPLIRIRNLQKCNIDTYYSGPYKDDYLIKRNDFLIGMDGEFYVSKWNNVIALLNQRICKIKTTKHINQEFLFYAIKKNIKQIEDITGATTVKHLSTKDIEKIIIIMPQNIKKQEKIAQILSTLDRNIEKTIKTIEKYRKVKKGLMDDLLNGKIRIKNGKWIRETEFKEVKGIGKVPKDWQDGSITSLAEINPRKDIKKLYKNDIVSFIGMEDTSEEAKILNMNNRKLAEVEKGYTNFHENDVLFAKITPCLENGKGGLAIGLRNGVGFGSTEFHVLRPKNSDLVIFVYQYSKYDKLRIRAASLMVGSAGQQRIGKDFFENYRIGIPSANEQKIIGNILDKQDQLIEKEEQYLQKLQKLKSGLMVDLLTGKKRVKF